MLSSEQYILESLETHLFFLRIMKEHLIFIEASLFPKDSALVARARDFKNQFESLLNQAVNLADGFLRPDTTASGEIVTPFTLRAEMVTQSFTGIPINTAITHSEISYTASAHITNIPIGLEGRVNILNQTVIGYLIPLIDFKSQILSSVLSCSIATHMYPTMLRHLIKEARQYLLTVQMLQRRDTVDTTREALEEEIFWDDIMGEHAKFIRGMLDPSEEALIKMADNFAKEFETLLDAAKKALENIALFESITNQSLAATKKIRDFKTSGVSGILDCKIQSIILPLLADHVLREANHHIRRLKSFKHLH